MLSAPNGISLLPETTLGFTLKLLMFFFLPGTNCTKGSGVCQFQTHTFVVLKPRSMQHGKQMKCKAFYCKKQIVGVFSGNAQQAGFINASVNVCMIAFFLKQSTLKMKMLLQFSDEMVLSMFFFFALFVL